MEEEILVSISLLVSNRKDTIRKCMESIKPLLDAVPSELIAVDTVGEENSDGSIAIVREYTDKIIYFPWCNDFAAARNAGLKEAKGKWFMFMDDDEWFEDITPITNFFLEGDYKHYDRAWYYVRNYHNYAGTEWVDTLVDRMCVISEKTEFRSKVHEYIYPAPSKVMQFFCYAHHYGYVYVSEEAKKKHSERNCSLLEQEVKEHPKDPRMVGQLVQEYAMIGRYEETAKMCAEWLSKNKKQMANPFTQFIVVLWLRVITQMEAWDRAKVVIKKIEREYSLKEVPRLALVYEKIRVKVAQEDYITALKASEEYFVLINRIIKLGEEAVLQQVFDLKRYMEVAQSRKVTEWAIASATKSGLYERAVPFLKSVEWSDKENRPFGFMMQLVNLYGKSGKEDLFFPYAEQIINNEEMKKPFIVALENLVRDYPECKDKIVSWLEEKNGGNKRKISPEMAQLVEELKNNIQILLNEGKVKEAKMLLEELKKYV